MHLVDELVGGVGEAAHGGAVVAGAVVVVPRPGARVGVAFRCDVLGGGAGGADAVDGGLVEGDDEGLVHVVVLVVGVEDDLGVAGVLLGELLPPRLEAGGVGDDGVVEAAVVVWGDHGIRALAGDVFDLFGQVAAVGCVNGAGEARGGETLHQEVDTEDVGAVADPSVIGRECVPSVVCVVHAWDVGVSKFGT